MPPRTAAEKAERKLLQEQKREARRLAKLKKEQERGSSKTVPNSTSTSESAKTTSGSGESPILKLPEVALRLIICYLPARDVGCLTLTSRQFALDLVEARVPYVISRLNRPEQALQGAVGFVDMCSNEEQAR